MRVLNPATIRAIESDLDAPPDLENGEEDRQGSPRCPLRVPIPRLTGTPQSTQLPELTMRRDCLRLSGYDRPSAARAPVLVALHQASRPQSNLPQERAGL